MIRKKRRKISDLFLDLLTWSIVVVMIFPIFWMILSSLKSNSEILTEKASFLLKDPQIANYVDLWTAVDFFQYFLNSIIICGITAMLSTLFAMFAGYALARFKFFGADFFGMGVIATQMIPGIMFLIPIYLLFTQLDTLFGIPMINTYWGMILVYTAFFTPMSIWIMRSFFVAIPKELEEAAIIDGCTPFMAFVRIIMPLSIPGVIATFTFAFLTAWDELLFAWILTTTADVQTIPVGIRLYVGQYQNRFDLLMAAAVVVTVPVMIAFFATQKYFIKGMTAGSVKG